MPSTYHNFDGDKPLKFTTDKGGKDDWAYETIHLKEVDQKGSVSFLGDSGDPFLAACRGLLTEQGFRCIPAEMATEIAALIEDYGTEDCTAAEQAVRAEMIRTLRHKEA